MFGFVDLQNNKQPWDIASNLHEFMIVFYFTYTSVMCNVSNIFSFFILRYAVLPVGIAENYFVSERIL